MTSLVRTSSNGFELSESVTLDTVQKYADEGRAEELFTPVERVFEELPLICLDKRNTQLYKNGVKLYIDKLGIENSTEDVRYRVVSYERKFMGLAFVKDGCLRVYKNFAQ